MAMSCWRRCQALDTKRGWWTRIAHFGKLIQIIGKLIFQALVVLVGAALFIAWYLFVPWVTVKNPGLQWVSIVLVTAAAAASLVLGTVGWHARALIEFPFIATCLLFPLGIVIGLIGGSWVAGTSLLALLFILWVLAARLYSTHNLDPSIRSYIRTLAKALRSLCRAVGWTVYRSRSMRSQ